MNYANAQLPFPDPHTDMHEKKKKIKKKSDRSNSSVFL